MSASCSTAADRPFNDNNERAPGEPMSTEPSASFRSAEQTEVPRADWTNGAPILRIVACNHCRHRWYLPRRACPRCGSADVFINPARGDGIVFSITCVMRAPNEALRAHVPYRLALVDLDEGVRVMTHAHDDVCIGDRVHLEFFDLSGRMVPRVARSHPA
jgi:uncharacterized OB-fold protein